METKITQEKVWEFIQMGDEDFDLESLRSRYEIDPHSSSFYTAISRLTEEKKIKRLGRGRYKRVKIVSPVKVFGRDRKDEIELYFPTDRETEMEMCFAEDIVFRAGDLVLLSGQSNQGKTALCLNFLAENIDKYPVLMGNEYTTIDNEPSPRLVNRLESMDWVQWTNGSGEEKFTLLPVREDYAEHIEKDKINIIDWINLDEHYMISKTMEDIKRELGDGIGIIAIQKAEGALSGRGGQFTKDFADCELLLDAHGDSEVRLTIGKVKEPRSRVMGRTFAYYISGGIKIKNFREIVKCPNCYGKGLKKQGNGYVPCDCTAGYIDK